MSCHSIGSSAFACASFRHFKAGMADSKTFNKTWKRNFHGPYREWRCVGISMTEDAITENWVVIGPSEFGKGVSTNWANPRAAVGKEVSKKGGESSFGGGFERVSADLARPRAAVGEEVSKKGSKSSSSKSGKEVSKKGNKTAKKK